MVLAIKIDFKHYLACHPYIFIEPIMDFSLSIAERKIPPNQHLLMDVKKRRLGHLALVRLKHQRNLEEMEQACSLCRSKIWMNHRVDSCHVLECYSMVLKQNIVLKIFHFLMNLRVNSIHM
jgi:hypothetical protein